MTSPARYVRTRDAQQAIEGREVEIVQALGIPWRAGQRDHITCPYPHHGGANDWRLNNKGRAICTCTGGKTDSVFEIIGKVESIDFEPAKVRAMEILGRADLVREKSDETVFQATDPASLLGAPPERRDDTLPVAYLAHRLGVDRDAVPRPSTAAVGLRALAYFDPPKGPRSKPPKVGEYPCAVFATRGAEGRQHAHRIYLAPGGAGKADLGLDANGKPRDPKKSAKREGEASTAGLSVVWGDAVSAPWCLLAEGIETAAAVAYAFQEEIRNGQAYVASAINAGGVAAFTPWPATRRITVAADRDEAPKPGRPSPTRAGEQAARTFGLRNGARVAVSIALAGDPGTGSDWLDVHGAHGSQAVRSGILGAVSYVATTEETEAERLRAEGAAEVATIADRYPLPHLDTLSLFYARTRSGRIWVHRLAKAGSDAEPQPVSSPVGVPYRLRYVDEADTYGLRLTVEDMGGRCRTVDVERAAFARQGAAETRAMLFAAGLRTEGEGEADLVRCLKAADPRDEIAVVRSPGWHTLDGHEDRFFVCPGGQIIGAPDGTPPELSVNARISGPVARGGTLEGWKAAVAAAIGAARCEHWTIGAIAGFAAPIIALCGMDTTGVNFSGLTSAGKTTAQRLAVSAWSRAALDQRDSLLQTARATANGVEMMAARSNATVLALDELGHVNGKELGRIIYSLASGVGKARMTADAQLRASHTWSTFVVLSAEKSLEEKVRGDGGEWFGGMAVRIPDIDVTGVDRAVDQAVMQRIQAVDQHFGHAGPAFVEALVSEGLHRKPHEIREGINRTAAAIAGAEADGATVRAAVPFAVLTTAGTMAKGFGLLPADLDVSKAVRWAWAKFQGSTDAAALNPEAQAVANLQGWIAERWGSSVHPTDPADGSRASNRDALGWYDEAAVYIPAARIVEAAGGTLKELEIGRALDRLGHLARTKGERHLYVDYVPRVGKVKAYALSREAFGRAVREPSFGVYVGGRA